MLRDHMGIPALTLDAVEARLDESYKKTLY